MVAEFGRGHLEAAVAGDDPDFFVRAGHLGADGRGQRESHGAQAAGSDQRARMLVMEVLRFPHLVLAYVGSHNGVAAGDAPEIVHHVCRIEMAGVGKILDVVYRNCALARFNCLEPCEPSRPATRGSNCSSTSRKIADQRHIDFDVLVDLSRVDFNVNLLGLQRIGRGGSGHAIVKAHAAGDEQIGFLDGVIHPRLAMHAHHAQVERMRCGKSAEAEQRERNRNLCALGKRVNLLHAPATRSRRGRRGSPDAWHCE